MHYKSRPELIRKAFITSLPVMAGYVILGIGFGILLAEKGYGLPWALAMSVFIYAGSLQYAGVSMIDGGVSLITAALTSLMINARHLFYSISMIDKYKGSGRYKPYLIFALTDETYSLLSDGSVPEGCEPAFYRFMVSLFNHCWWISGSVLGSLMSSSLPFSTKGIEFSMTALFVSAFAEQWYTSKDHTAALCGLVCSVISLLVFGPDDFLIPSMAAIMVCLIITGRRRI